MSGCQIDRWTTVNQVIQEFRKETIKQPQSAQFLQIEFLILATKAPTGDVTAPCYVSQYIKAWCVVKISKQDKEDTDIYSPGNCPKLIMQPTSELGSHDIANPKIANGDGHQVDFKFCYSKNSKEQWI